MELSLDEIIRANPDNFKVKDKNNKGKSKQRTAAVQTPANLFTVKTSGLHTRNAGVSTSTPKKVVGGVERVVISKKLLLSNLDMAVTDHDLQELFCEFGELESIHVHYDKHGRSLGVADIVYKKPVDALRVST